MRTAVDGLNLARYVAKLSKEEISDARYRNGKKKLFMGIFKGIDKYRKTLQVNMVEKGKLKCGTDVLIYAAQDQALRTKLSLHFPAGIYLFKFNNRNTRTKV